MPMKPEEYEGLMTELNSPEIALERKTEILQSLRKDYSNVLEDHEKLSKQLDSLTKEKDELLLTNSKLFRSSTFFTYDKEKEEDQKQKTFSETVKLSDIEKRAGAI